MNVKSYLKGIGVGMIVASLILIIAGNMNKVSDEEVIARAKELGYVQSTTVSQPEVVDNTSSNTEQIKIEDSDKVESTDNNVASVGDQVAEDANDDKATNVNTADANADDKANDANADDKATDANTNNANTDDKTTDADVDSNVTDSANADNSTETANTTNDTTVSDGSDKTATSSETVKVEIRSGMSSESAALAVKNAGLVESDTEFNKYLCSEGYDKRLRVGSFEIPKDADFETIAKSLCGMK